jgi:hypothetical protein
VSVLSHPTIAALQAAIEGVRAMDWQELSDAAAVTACEQLLTAESQLRAAQTRLIARIDQTGASEVECGRLTRSWLIEEQLLAPADAGKRIDLARGLRSRPATEKAFDAGDLTADQASIIVKALRHVPDAFADIVEGALVDQARVTPPHQLATDRDVLLAACGVETSADERAALRHAGRSFRLTTTFDGNAVPDGVLTPEVAEQVRLALAAAGESLPEPGDGDRRTRAQAHHDALGAIAGFYLAHADTAEDNGHRPQLVVTVDYDTLAGRIDNTHGRLDSGLPLAPETVRRIGCDADVIPTVLGSRSEVLDIGRATRTWPRAVRRAAKLDQRGRCAFPRCRRPLAELHHIVHWANGGPTNLSNAAWLCAFHHWLVHEGNWTLERRQDGGLVFTAPHGTERVRGPSATSRW